ncbi:hypothetical protein M569_02940, partial [Genlisea aurea]
FLALIVVFPLPITLCFIFLRQRAAQKEMKLHEALIKQMEATQHSENKSRNKSLAFARASHDIRASLTGISSLIELSEIELYQKADPRPDLRTNLQQMGDCTKSLQGILNSILDTSKIEAGKMQLEEEGFDMEELIEEVVDFFHPVGRKKGVDVIFDPSDGSIRKHSRVKGDRPKLKQILNNLLSNAVKYTPEGHVIVRAHVKGRSLEKNRILVRDERESTSTSCCFLFNTEEKVSSEPEDVERNPKSMEFTFEVNDTGKGIPREQRKSVFENYVRVSETAHGQEGTGLGLGIVQSLVRLMGGEIKIVDKKEGERGTCIRFSIIIETEASNDSAETNDGGYTISDSFYHHRSPFLTCLNRTKNEGSQLILFIKSNERSKILHSFIWRLGIKVRVVKKHAAFIQSLKIIKQGINLSSNSSSQNSKSDAVFTWNKRSKGAPLSAFDGAGDASPPRKNTGFILMVIDKDAGPFHDINEAIVEFRRDLNEDCCSRVIWLDIPDANSASLPSLDESKLPPPDLIISKAFHGSRLYQAIQLLPEFGGSLPRRGEIPQHVETPRQRICKRAPAEEIKNTSDDKPLKGKAILVVEDDPIGQKIAVSIVQRLGANVSVCNNGEEACALVSTSLQDEGTSGSVPPFSCILMDCEMPVMNGIEATQRIREVEEKYGARTLIVALTAHEKGEEIDKMIQAGVDSYMTKPLNTTSFLKAISKI